MSKFYGDIARDYSDSFTTGFYGGNPVIIKLKTKPSEKVGLHQTFKVHREITAKDDAETVSHHVENGVAVKVSCSDNQVATKFKFNNEEGIYEVAYKPKDVNKDGKSLTLKHNSTFNADTKVVASTESVKFGSGLFADAKVGLTVDYSW
jgi:hypothetical protein